MLQSFADSKPVRDTFAEAAEVLGQDLWQLAADGPAEDLNSTVNTQPLMLAAGYAVYRRGARRAVLHPRSSRVIVWANTRRWWWPASFLCAMRCRWSACARKPCRTRCRSAPARWPPSSGWTTTRYAPHARERARRSRRSGEFQRAEPGRDRGTKGGGRARRCRRQGQGGEARGDVAGQRTVSRIAAQARRRALEQVLAGITFHARKFRSSTTSMSLSLRTRSNQGRARAAGLQPCALG